MTNKIEIETNRQCTNVWALISCVILVLITLILVGYCSITGNPSRFGKPHDDCGNFCGEFNDDNPFKCGVKDLRHKPKLQIKFDPKSNAKDPERRIMHTCVERCPPGFKEKFNYCIKRNQIKEFGKDALKIADGALEAIFLTIDSILIICFVAFCFSYVFLFLFRYVAIYVIWIINIGCIIFAIFLTFAAIYIGQGLLAVFMAVTALILIIILVFFRNRIGLVARLFREASKALMDMPAIMFEPILTFVFLILASAVFIKFSIIIETSAETRRYKISNKNSIQISYEERTVNNVAHVLNGITFVWFTQFLYGCQHFVIAGTISKWYFTPDKSKLDSPIKTAFSNLLRFHLGSICLGACLITIVKIIKSVLSLIENQIKSSQTSIGYAISYCLKFLTDLFDEILEYLVRNAYIIVAKEGTGFVDSGKRAYHLLSRNIVDVIALNSFGDLVLFVCRLLIVLIAGFVGYGILDTPDTREIMEVPLVVGIILALLIAHCFVTVFEMTIDTIFVCFCIDSEDNNGSSNPYFMSDSLKKILMEMKEHSSMFLLTNEKGHDAESGAGIAEGSRVAMLSQQPGSKVVNSSNFSETTAGTEHQIYQQPTHSEEPYFGQLRQDSWDK